MTAKDLDSKLRDEQKLILEKILSKLTSLRADLYYASTIDVSNEIREQIVSGNFISEDEKEVVSNLSPKDIQMILSFSSCCD